MGQWQNGRCAGSPACLQPEPDVCVNLSRSGALGGYSEAETGAPACPCGSIRSQVPSDAWPGPGDSAVQPPP